MILINKIHSPFYGNQVEYEEFYSMTFEVFMDILISVVGIFVLLGIAVLFSNNRKAINLRTVLVRWLFKSLSVLSCFMYRLDAVRYKRLLILSVKSSASVTKGLVSYSVDWLIQAKVSVLSLRLKCYRSSFLLRLDFFALLHRCYAMGDQLIGVDYKIIRYIKSRI